MRKISSKEKIRKKEYEKLRKDYLLNHPICECCEMQIASEIHHKRGRIGDNLFKYFLAVCNSCHRQIETNPTWAKENGYSESRLKIDNGDINSE